MFTNGDNMYIRGFIDKYLAQPMGTYDLIGFDFISRYVDGSFIIPHNPVTAEVSDGSAHLIHAGFGPSQIDLGRKISLNWQGLLQSRETYF